VHGDAAEGVPGQLEQRLGRGPVDGAVPGLEVAHQGGHGAHLPERLDVALPGAAGGHGLGQVTTELVTGLRAE